MLPRIKNFKISFIYRPDLLKPTNIIIKPHELSYIFSKSNLKKDIVIIYNNIYDNIVNNFKLKTKNTTWDKLDMDYV